ncbi:MAG TPA: hypothetical protein VN231_07735 [Allosphingosinicella sp.]|nr:hypothetical protein [Allosphingosinicella sp.]
MERTGRSVVTAPVRYYFNIFDDVSVVDEEGQELPDEAAARREAVRGGRELMCDQVRQGRLNLSHRIEVADEQGRVVLTLPFGALVKIEGE